MDASEKKRLETERKNTPLDQNRNNGVKRCKIFQVGDFSCNAEESRELDDVGLVT